MSQQNNHGKVCPNNFASEVTNDFKVGDTPADTIMGQAANLGLTVGVLTGVGDNKDLSDADLIVPEVGDVIDLVTPSEKSEMVRIFNRTNDKLTSNGCN